MAYLIYPGDVKSSTIQTQNQEALIRYMDAQELADFLQGKNEATNTGIL